MLNAGQLAEIMELQKLAGMEKFSKLTVKQEMDREKLIELLEDRRLEASEVCGSMNKGFGAWYADHLIANDVVPVVPCKDCTHYVLTDFRKPNEDRWCELSDDGYRVKYPKPYDFCSYGERKDNA